MIPLLVATCVSINKQSRHSREEPKGHCADIGQGMPSKQRQQNRYSLCIIEVKGQGTHRGQKQDELRVRESEGTTAGKGPMHRRTQPTHSEQEAG